MGTGEDGTRTTLEQRAGEAVSHTNEYNVVTTELARWEGNTWVVEVTNVKTGALSQQRRWLEGQNTMRFVRLPDTTLTLGPAGFLHSPRLTCTLGGIVISAIRTSAAASITMRGEVESGQTTHGGYIPWLGDVL